jgi:hypothetical protein
VVVDERGDPRRFDPLPQIVIGPWPSDEDRRRYCGMAWYGCPQGHVWTAPVKYGAADDPRQAGRVVPMVPFEPSLEFCECDPCASLSDERARGRRIGRPRHWTPKARSGRGR